MILIDALNEGAGERLWFNHLPGMLAHLENYPRVGLAISVRSSYEEIIVPDSDPIFRMSYFCKPGWNCERSKTVLGVLVAETVYQGHSSMPKTRASNRKVFIQDLALEALTSLTSSESRPDDFVFATSKGTPFNPNNVRNRILIPACRRAGIPLIGWHDLRRTFATWSNPRICADSPDRQ